MSTSTSTSRQLSRSEFYCDGHYTVLSSASRGGMDISDEKLAEALQETEPVDLIQGGVVMPLEFQGDCALGNVAVLVGDLSEREEAEWIGRVSSRLKIPCGKFLLLAGGGDPYDWENAVDEDPDDDTVFSWVEVAPGDYLVEVYAFASSMTAAYHFEEGEFSEWFDRTRPGLAKNEYVTAVSEGNGYDVNDDYMDYLIRLKPWSDSDKSRLSKPTDGWFSEFTFRRPELCPLGISYAELGLGLAGEDDED